jgi:hypothetical protein
MFAEDGSVGVGDHNGRAELTIDTHSMLADNTGPGTAGDYNGRAELVIDPHWMLAGGRAGLGGDV